MLTVKTILAKSILNKSKNYVNTNKWIYRKFGFQREMEDRYFEDTRERLVLELNKRCMQYEVFF